VVGPPQALTRTASKRAVTTKIDLVLIHKLLFNYTFCWLDASCRKKFPDK